MCTKFYLQTYFTSNITCLPKIIEPLKLSNLNDKLFIDQLFIFLQHVKFFILSKNNFRLGRWINVTLIPQKSFLCSGKPISGVNFATFLQVR